MGHAVSINGGFKLSPSLLERMAAPHPRVVTESVPINVNFLADIEGSDSMRVVTSCIINQKHNRDTYLQTRT